MSGSSSFGWGGAWGRLVARWGQGPTKAAEPDIAQAWLAVTAPRAQALARQIGWALDARRRPGVIIVRQAESDAAFALGIHLEHALGGRVTTEGFLAGPSDAADAQAISDRIVAALRAGRSPLFVLPHERHLECLDAGIDLVVAWSAPDDPVGASGAGSVH